MKYLFGKINELPVEKRKPHSMEKFLYAFINKNPIFVDELLPLIENSLENESFQAEVMRAYKNDCMNEKAALLKKIEAKHGDKTEAVIYISQLDLINKRLTITTIQQLIKYLSNYLIEYQGELEILNGYYKNIHTQDGSSYIKKNYTNYKIGSILFSKYESSRRRIEILDQKYSEVVKSEYKKININIEDTDTQFFKYKLVSLNDKIRIINRDYSQAIHDKRMKQYFTISVPQKLLASIEKLIEKKCCPK